MKLVLTTLLVFIEILSHGQTKQCFHEFCETASDIHISKWNIDKENLPLAYVQETVDSENRVIELKFFKNKSLNYSHLCYINIWIKYEYPNDTTIIEYYFDSKGEEIKFFDCDRHTKTTFILSKDKRTILKSKSEYSFYDKEVYLNNGWTTEKELNKMIESLKSEKLVYKSVLYYNNSYHKLNNIFPVSKEFNIDSFILSEKEKEQIIKSMEEK